MIPRFSDHAANERTFLAWVRTGIATIAFGFVVEKFNLFLRTLATAALSGEKGVGAIAHSHNALGHYDGTVLVFFGILLIVVATWRFVRASRLIDSEESYPITNVRTEVVLSLILIAAALAAYVAFS
ncbi:MAG: DUF202 domain-containing protein [Rhizobiales bacterium]|nr:DUF202 domain-containing protein [Hyphomicrobiales bacterium]OJY07660.1 MAG: hypothetical protein BGP07_06015 [Rhizobiales bacterium 63-22]